MNIVLKSKIISFTILVLIAWSCQKSFDDERLDVDNAAIERFLKNNNLNFTLQDGVYHAIRNKGYGYRVTHGDSISFWYVGYTFSSKGFVFDTNVFQVALNNSLDTSFRSFDPVETVAGSSELIEGLRQGLMMCRENELSVILFSSIYGYGNQTVGTIPPWSPLAYDIKIISVINDRIKEEQKNISNFVSQNEGFIPDTLGFWKKFLFQSGLEYRPSIGDTIYGWYRKRVLNGNIFNETPIEGQQIILGDTELTEGITLGFLLMSPTESLELVVPSYLGYGVNGYGTISPYTPLFYELRLDSIK